MSQQVQHIKPGHLYLWHPHSPYPLLKYATSTKFSPHIETPWTGWKKHRLTHHWPFTQPSSPSSRRSKPLPLPQTKLDRIVMYTRVLWGTQYVALYFASPTPEDGKILTFAQDIRLR